MSGFRLPGKKPVEEAMRTFEFLAQSPRWPGFVISLPDESRLGVGQTQMWSGRATVSVTKSGTTTWVDVQPDESGEKLAVLFIQFDGKVIESTRSQKPGTVELYIASRGGWSGGDRWHGVAIGREGALLALGCSGRWTYYEVVGGQWVKSRPPATK